MQYYWFEIFITLLNPLELTYFLLDNQKISIRNYNNIFLILKTEDSENSDMLSEIGSSIYQGQFDFIEEVIISEVEICLQLNTHYKPNKLFQLISSIISKVNSKPEVLNQRIIVLPILFENENDWHRITKITKLNKTEYINKLESIELTVKMYGFLPGFVYLTGLPKNMHCPRKNTPALQVHPNSFAIGAQYAGIYSLPSPAGWNIIGISPFSILNTPNVPPNLLQVGDKIKIKSIDKNTYLTLHDSQKNIITYND